MFREKACFHFSVYVNRQNTVSWEQDNALIATDARHHTNPKNNFVKRDTVKHPWKETWKPNGISSCQIVLKSYLDEMSHGVQSRV